MRITDPFKAPEPVKLRVVTTARREDFAASLSEALTQCSYSNPGEGEVLMRLRDGHVDASAASFTVARYFLPGLWARGNIDKLVVGRFHDTPTGSEFIGLISAPLTRRVEWFYIGASALAALAFAGFEAIVIYNLSVARAERSPILMGLLAGLLVLLLAFVVIQIPAAILGTLAYRSMQRANLGQAPSIERFLQDIAADAEPEPSPSLAASPTNRAPTCS